VLRPGSAASRGGLAWIEQAAALPVLGHHGGNRFVRSRFEWDFREASAEPAVLDLSVGPGFTPLPLRAAATCPDGVYAVRNMRWRLSWPVPVLG
jgi:hypothetical protein